MQALNPFTMPLKGKQLLEASAGTGKTYTLVLLYLRLVVEKQMAVDQILVVTFTRAATEELRDRIRTKLRDVLDMAEGRTAIDPELRDILAKLPPAELIQLLGNTLTRMDEAAIFTIHGFCQRLLQDHAFESSTPFSMELLESEQQLRMEIIEDFWRQRFYSASEQEALWAMKKWQSPQKLLQTTTGPLFSLNARIIPEDAPESLPDVYQECQQQFQSVLAAWPGAREEVEEILFSDKGLQRNEKAYRLADVVPQLLQELEQFCNQKAFPWILASKLPLVSASVMAGKIKKKYDPPEHSFFVIFDQFYITHTAFINASTIHFLHQLREYFFTELARRKEQAACLGFDDLLLHLDTALHNPNGPLLAQQIRHRYPATLVDEFQDTDPLQYQILSRVYGNSSLPLIMIGDPKQAIYSFRGADIFTYIKARRETASENRYTMATNYRSTQAMVHSVNTLFAKPQSFVFEEDIPFIPVQARADQEEQLLLDGIELTALNVLLLRQNPDGSKPKPINKETARIEAAALSARTIASLLDTCRSGQAMLGKKTFAAGDIAVLVRTNKEGSIVQQALQELEINSVYYSQESVFASTEAKHLYTLLAALSNPADTRMVRNCLVTDLCGYTGSELYQVMHCPQEWEQVLQRLFNLKQRWLDKGLMAMYHLLLSQMKVTENLSALPGGDRMQTNYLHLIELLQEAELELQAPADLLHWFQQQMVEPGVDIASQQLRLENDEQLVRIITIHKAKGLEFPVVFLPFLWSNRSPQKGEPHVFHDRETFSSFIDIGTGEKQNQILAREEQLAEDLRLLYVAITRAKHCCYLCWGLVSGMQESGLAYLLHQQEDGKVRVDSEDSLVADLEALKLDQLTIISETSANTGSSSSLPKAGPLPAVKHFTGSIGSHFQITSYSQLASNSGHGAEPVLFEREPSMTPPTGKYQQIADFPRGTAAGTCLHAILEQLDFMGPLKEQHECIRENLRRAAFDEQWLPLVSQWMKSVLATDLGTGCHLNALSPGDKLDEMAFLFSLEQLDVVRFNSILTNWNIPPLANTRGQLQGLMKGFIDLVFRYNGLYYIADYKSNFLGLTADNYNPEALQTAMLEHRYDLQYLIYTLAMHRYLGQRIPDYRYTLHYGGVYYLFLRAMVPDYPAGSGIFYIRPDQMLIEQLDQCCRGLEVC